jgi:branched-chain amino acid transport system substrate-binding protein
MKLIYLLCLLLIVAVGCTQPMETTETITIGGIFALSGNGAQFGTDEMQGAQLAVEEINAKGGINGQPIDFIVEDFQTDGAKIVSAYRKLVNIDEARYIIGATWGPFSAILIPLLESEILISPSTGEELELYKNSQFFKTWPADKSEIPILIEHMENSEVQNVAIVTSQGSWEQGMRANFYEVWSGSKIQIVEDITLSVDQVDFRTNLLKLQDQNIDAIYLILNKYEATGEFSKQMIEMDFLIPIYTRSGIEQQSLLQNYDSYLEHMVYPLPVLTKKDALFNKKFNTKFGHDPLTPVAATSYDAVKMLAIALEQGGNITNNLLNIRNYSGASAIQNFNEFGWAEHDREFRLRTVSDGSFVDVK